MAARSQRHAVSGPNHRRVGSPPVYEDFKPDTEWKAEAQSDNLLIQLPGFAKEHLKVSMVGTTELRIRGERLVGGDHQWSRFEKAVAIPEDCNRSGIRAKFENSVLTITMPKKAHTDSPVVPQPSPKQENKAKTTTTTPEQALISDQKRKAEQKEVQSKKQKHDDFPKQENDRKSLAEHFSSGQEASKPPPPTEGSTKTPESVITPPGSDAAAEEGSVDHKGAPERSTKTPESVINSGVKEETREKDGRPDLTYTKVTETEKGTLTSGGGIMNGFKFDKYMQAVKDKFTKRTEMNEERQLMVNVGTAVMVIVGLSAYISYTTGLSG